MNKKVLIKLFIFIFFISPLFSQAEIKIQQPVDVSCNENFICELELNENLDTCPTDCRVVNPVNPEILQKGLMGGSIEIYNIEVLVGIGGTIITWETNKPTVTSLILSDETGEIKKGYIDEFYVTQHSVMIDSFIFSGDYFFKIFSKGIYGDDNYDDAKLFIIKQNYQNQFYDEEIQEMKDEFISSKTIEVSSENLNHSIISPNNYEQENSVSEFIKTNFSKFSNNTISFFIVKFIWQILIGIGILSFVLLFLRKK